MIQSTMDGDMGGGGHYIIDLGGDGHYYFDLGGGGQYAVDLGGGGQYVFALGGGGQYSVTNYIIHIMPRGGNDRYRVHIVPLRGGQYL